MSINVLRIDPDGTISAYEEADPLRLAKAKFDHAEVVTCRNLFTSETSIGVVNATGRLDALSLKEKAWALYGRSPIFGPMHLSARPAIPDAARRVGRHAAV